MATISQSSRVGENPKRISKDPKSDLGRYEDAVRQWGREVVLALRGLEAKVSQLQGTEVKAVQPNTAVTSSAPVLIRTPQPSEWGSISGDITEQTDLMQLIADLQSAVTMQIADAIAALTIVAADVDYDDTVTGLGVANVQAAIEALKNAIDAIPGGGGGGGDVFDCWMFG